MNKRIKININYIIVFFILALMHNFFYLMPSNIGPLNYYDILFGICAILILYNFFRRKERFLEGEFKWIILCVPLLVVLSSIAASINFDQSVLSGILTQRAWLITVGLYFVLLYFIRTNKINVESFYKILYLVTFLELVLYFTQFFVGESRFFLNVNHNYRYGTLRLYCSTNYMLLTAMIAMEKVLKKEKEIKSILMIVLIVAYFIIVNKGRSATVGLIVALGMVLLLSRNVSRLRKIIIIFFASIAVIVFLSDSTAIQEFINIIFNDAYDGTYDVRLQSQHFYLGKWTTSLPSFLFGYGYANSTIPASLEAVGATRGYLYADNGIFAFISCYGVVGLLWFIGYNLILLKNALRLYKDKSVLVFVKLLIGLLTISVNINYFYSYYSFDAVLTMFFCELLMKEKVVDLNSEVM